MNTITNNITREQLQKVLKPQYEFILKSVDIGVLSVVNEIFRRQSQRITKVLIDGFSIRGDILYCQSSIIPANRITAYKPFIEPKVGALIKSEEQFIVDHQLPETRVYNHALADLNAGKFIGYKYDNKTIDNSVGNGDTGYRIALAHERFPEEKDPKALIETFNSIELQFNQQGKYEIALNFIEDNIANDLSSLVKLEKSEKKIQ